MKFIVGFLVFFTIALIGGKLVGPTLCSDGWASQSIGRQGACSSHGGVNRTPGNIVMILSIVGGILAAKKYGDRASRISMSRQRVQKPPAWKDTKAGDVALKKNTVVNRDVTSKTNSSNSVHDSVTNQEDLLPSCPSCGSSMVSRVAKKGKLRGNKFYGCSQYPKCKSLINV